GYVGVIGEQEGIDLLLESAKYITEKRNDIQFAILGGGTSLDAMKALCTKLNLNNYIDFYGRVSDETLMEVLNTTDVCVNPDKPSEMNNLSTMNKIMEYMALKKPIVQYDLKEGRISAQKASLYAENNNTKDFAEKILYLIDNPNIREKMAEYGYHRIINELSWEHENKNLVNVYNNLLYKSKITSLQVNT
ncbi:MAG TPA: glycosyltransferase, partial [Draconibacterium sp.]|nr:glycosyltransferase [Draconibacterium sp.]